MTNTDARHYTEEEILMHLLHEETAGTPEQIAGHAAECGECASVLAQYRILLDDIREWTIPEHPGPVWEAQKARLLAGFHADREMLRHGSIWPRIQWALRPVWNYALENPLPTMAYIAVATAFALERTVSTLRLDRLLPATGELFEILSQVL